MSKVIVTTQNSNYIIDEGNHTISGGKLGEQQIEFANHTPMMQGLPVAFYLNDGRIYQISTVQHLRTAPDINKNYEYTR